MPRIFIFLNGFSISEIKLLYGFQSVHAPPATVRRGRVLFSLYPDNKRGKMGAVVYS